MATSGPQYTSRTMDTLGEGGGERMVAASAERNKDPILEQLARLFPPAEGGDPGSDPSSEAGGDLVLEVSSGTGQHVAHFARALPHLRFLPTELTDETFPSIASWCAGLPNALPPRVLDCASGAAWDALGLEPESCRGCYVANLCHISPFGVTAGLVAGAAKVLRPGGLLCVYGPFMVDGEHTSGSNAALF